MYLYVVLIKIKALNVILSSKLGLKPPLPRNNIFQQNWTGFCTETIGLETSFLVLNIQRRVICDHTEAFYIQSFSLTECIGIVRVRKYRVVCLCVCLCVCVSVCLCVCVCVCVSVRASMATLLGRFP